MAPQTVIVQECSAGRLGDQPANRPCDLRSEGAEASCGGWVSAAVLDQTSSPRHCTLSSTGTLSLIADILGLRAPCGQDTCMSSKVIQGRLNIPLLSSLQICSSPYKPKILVSPEHGLLAAVAFPPVLREQVCNGATYIQVIARLHTYM